MSDNDNDETSRRKVIVDHDLAAASASDLSGSYASSNEDYEDGQLAGIAKTVLRGRRLEVFERLISQRPAYEEKSEAIRDLVKKHGVEVDRIYEDLARAKEQIRAAYKQPKTLAEASKRAARDPNRITTPRNDLDGTVKINVTYQCADGTAIRFKKEGGVTLVSPIWGHVYGSGDPPSTFRESARWWWRRGLKPTIKK